MNQQDSLDHIGLAENISLSASDARLLIAHGNRQHDRFIQTLPNKIVDLELLIHQALEANATWLYDCTEGTASMVDGEGKLSSELPENIQERKNTDLHKLLIELQNKSRIDFKSVLVIESALLFEDSNNPTGKDLELLRSLEKISRQTTRNLTIVLKTDNIRSIPSALSSSSFTATIAIPVTNRDERYTYVEMRGNKLASEINTDVSTLACLIAGITDQWNLHRVDRLIETARQSCSCISDIETLAQAIMTGVTKSPWMGKNIREVVRNCSEQLEARVIGQPAAIEAVITTLKKSVTGLSASTQSSASTAPKGVFFFAGPTGTGKTELTKTLAQLIYGSESNLIRFDCGELQQEHSVQRLIGAPPGYVGYEAGGELTDAVAANPSSVVLFDEIEKAHPRLLDTLLSVLDDGRLTNGQGHVTYFTDALIVFTSNLGMHGEDESGDRNIKFDYDTPFHEMESGIRDEIAKTFNSRLERPELLGRLGGKENIVVFDYLRDIDGVVNKFIENIKQRLSNLHKIELVIEEEVINKLNSDLNDNTELLSLGGRGISQTLERNVVNPLAGWLFDNQETSGAVHVTLEEDDSLSFTQN